MQFSLALDEKPILSLLRVRLISVFGPQRDTHRLDPTSQLVNAMISSRTRDDVSLPAFDRLTHRYASWDSLMQAAPEAIAGTIHPVMFAERKALQLVLALRMIRASTGSFDLRFLADFEDEIAMQWLTRLPGVGAKIAAAVLNFSTLRKRTLAVDTHLLRIGERLGLLPQGANSEIGYDLFMRFVPNAWDADDLYEFHWLLKYHGQKICTHAAPACAHCSIQDLCPSRFPKRATARTSTSTGVVER